MTTTDQKSKGVDAQLVHAMAHRVRVHALVVLTERTASPKEVSRELGVSLGVVSHHIHELLNLGWIELVREEPRRGAMGHYYRSIIRPELDTEQWEHLSLEERQRFSLWVIQLIMSDIAKAFDAGTFDARADRHLSRVPLYLDKEGWNELVEIQNQALEATFEVQAASAARFAEDKERDGLHVSAAMLCTQMPIPRQKRPD